MPRVLITGATGFIGQACLKALEKSHLEIHATYRKEPISQPAVSYWYPCDILNSNDVSALIKQVKPDFLIHLAWVVDHKIYWTSEKNIDYIFATVNMYKEFSAQGGKKAIFIGTCAEYDNTFSHCEENTTPLNPNTLYGLCKKHTLNLLNNLKAQNSNYAEFTWIRLFNIYGPNEHPDRLIPYLFLSYLQRKIPHLSNPTCIRDYIYVENLASIVVWLMTNVSQQVINLGSGEHCSIEELATIIYLRYFKDQAPPTKQERISNQPELFVPNLTLLQKLNIPPQLSFETGLDHTFVWFKNTCKEKLI